ncbi:MAG: hypothetical protein AAGA06_02460 [Pseudomonadota bacterium]
MKDTYEIYDPHDTEAVRAYRAKLAAQALARERNGVAVMGPFLMLASAADPKSGLSQVIRCAKAFCIIAPLAFALAWVSGAIG